MDISLPLNAVLDRIDYSSFDGELGVRNITGVASLKEARKGDASFIASNKYLEDLQASEASLVILSGDIQCEPKRGQLFLRVEKPSIEIAKLCELIATRMWPKLEPEVHRLSVIDPSASVDPSAHIGPFVTIGENVEIGPGCVILSGTSIGPSCKLGKDCYLSANVTLERDTVLGDRVRIHAGAVLGSDGFGYEFEGGRHRKVPQIGSVEVGNDVEIGANTAIDRGRFGPTRIGEGSKIDNLVQIGHNTIVGKHCILCGQTGIAGSTTIGNYVVMGGGAGTAGHLSIGDGAQLSGRCTVYSDLEGGKKYGGDPAVPLVAYQRIRVVTRKLPELFTRLKHLEAQLLDK